MVELETTQKQGTFPYCTLFIILCFFLFSFRRENSYLLLWCMRLVGCKGHISAAQEIQNVWRPCTMHLGLIPVTKKLATVLTIAQHEGCWKELEQYGVSSVWSHTGYPSLLSQPRATPRHGSHTWARCEKLSEWQHSLLLDGLGSQLKQPVLHWYHSPLINHQIHIFLFWKYLVCILSINFYQTKYYCMKTSPLDSMSDNNWRAWWRPVLHSGV